MTEELQDKRKKSLFSTESGEAALLRVQQFKHRVGNEHTKFAYTKTEAFHSGIANFQYQISFYCVRQMQTLVYNFTNYDTK